MNNTKFLLEKENIKKLKEQIKIIKLYILKQEMFLDELLEGNLK